MREDETNPNSAEPSACGEVPAIDLKELSARVSAWRSASAKTPNQAPERTRFTTSSGIEVPDVLTPLDVSSDYLRDLGLPGEYPFTRGVQRTMYRGRPWTMRMFAG